MDRGAWQATVHRVAQSQTPLKRLSSKQQQVQPRKRELLKLPKLLFVVAYILCGLDKIIELSTVPVIWKTLS